MRFSVDTWDPSYGSAEEDRGLDTPTSVVVDASIEREPGAWQGLRPAHHDEPVVFVDGVRRIEARVWIEGEDGRVDAGWCASWGAGAVRCDDHARVVAAGVGRAVVSPAASLADVRTPHAVFVAVATGDDTPEALSLAVQNRMLADEVRAAEAARRADPALLVVDGPLRGRDHLPDAVGLIKTHHTRYLEPPLERVVATLAPGERSPLFELSSSWSRLAWYLRLAQPAGGGPLAGIVRCEIRAGLPVEAAVALADRASALLPRFASEPHKDARAPQNLYPIGGLERELRRRLGEQHLLVRSLRVAARAQ